MKGEVKVFFNLSPFFKITGYDGVPNFYEHLVELIVKTLKDHEEKMLFTSMIMEKSLVIMSYSKSPEYLMDSGIGSCTESDSSDCERKLKALRITTETIVEEKVNNVEPSWKRIKKFYGIPKPPTKPRSGTIP